MKVISITSDVDTFFTQLEPMARARILNAIDMLERYGNRLGMPCSKSLGGGLFELRTSGKQKVRVLYCFHNDTAYLLHGFVKKSGRISLKDLEIARDRRNLL